MITVLCCLSILVFLTGSKAVFDIVRSNEDRRWREIIDQLIFPNTTTIKNTTSGSMRMENNGRCSMKDFIWFNKIRNEKLFIRDHLRVNGDTLLMYLEGNLGDHHA